MVRSLRMLAVALTLLAALATLATTPIASATTVVRLSDVELARESQLVVVATVVEQRALRDDDGVLYTDSLLSVDEVLLGTADTGAHLSVRQLGGRDGDETLVVPGDARLRPGDQAVFFLADRTPGTGTVYLTALGQSKLDVIGRTDDGDLLLGRDLTGLTFYDPSADDPLYALDQVEVLTLSALRASLEEAQR